MSSIKEAAGPKFIRYFVPVISVLAELGASATKAEIRDAVAKKLGLTDAEVNEVNEKGSPVFGSKVHWAVWYLSRAGYVSSSQRGVWSLTEKGQTEPINRVLKFGGQGIGWSVLV
jgi:restriction system protein